MRSLLQGRDGHRNMQRGIKAEEMWRHMPAQIDKLRKALVDWQAAEGAPFAYDGRDYQVGGCPAPTPCVWRQARPVAVEAAASLTVDCGKEKHHKPAPPSTHV